MNKKRIQGASKMRTCNKCGKEIRARGFNGHMRMIHGVKLTTEVITTQVKNIDSSPTQVTIIREIEQKVKTQGAGAKIINVCKENKVDPHQRDGNTELAKRILHHQAHKAVRKRGITGTVPFYINDDFFNYSNNTDKAQEQYDKAFDEELKKLKK